MRFIVPIVPGSSPDIVARIFGERLSERWHQPVVIENRAGAEGLIGTAAFAHMLTRAYEFGALSDDFDTLESFLVTARLAGINDAAVTVELWERAKAWRNSSAN